MICCIFADAASERGNVLIAMSLPLARTVICALFAFTTKPSNLSSPVCFGFGFTALTMMGAAVSAMMIGTVAGTAAPIIVSAVKPKPKQTGLDKFEGFVVNANSAQITVRAKGNDMAIRTFPLSEAASAKMQQIIDKGGYQYGDKVTVYYVPATEQAIKFKVKPSKPI